MNKLRVAHAALCAIVVAALSCNAAAPAAKPGDGLVANPDGFAWEDGPPGFPKGARIARLSGDPTKAAPYAVMIKLPGSYDVPAHWYDRDVQILLVSGRLFVGLGDAIDLDRAERAKPVSYIFLPAGKHFFLRARTKVMFEVHGMGPLEPHFAGRK